jgi:class 3 adenylate cyclase
VTPERPEAQLPAVRVSDDDRTRAVDVLRGACAEGRITLDEFADRAGLAYAARTPTDLDVLTADLPVATSEPRREATRRIVAIMSGTRRRGRWRVGREVRAFAFWGGAKLDLREAELDEPAVTIRATAIMGGIDIIVPDGVDVDMTGVAIMGGKECRVKDGPRRPGAPLVRVRVFAFWGGVSVRSASRQRARHVAPEAPTVPAVPTATPPRTNPRDTPAQHTVTLLITDIEDFTGLTERLGDSEAQVVLREHNSIVRRRAGERGGHEVKAIGDSFMLSFTSATAALRCAADVQRDLAARTSGGAGVPLRVRMGIHTGEALHEDDDLFGRTVIVASRIAAAACGGEVLASSLVVDLAAGDPSLVFDEGREVALKGVAQSHRVHALKWDIPDPTPA